MLFVQCRISAHQDFKISLTRGVRSDGRPPINIINMTKIKVRPRYKTKNISEDYLNMKGHQTRITVDGQETTIQEIFERSNQGLLQRQHVDQDNDQDNAIDLEEFQLLDPVEQQEIIDQHKADLQQLVKTKVNQAIEFKASKKEVDQEKPTDESEAGIKEEKPEPTPKK